MATLEATSRDDESLMKQLEGLPSPSFHEPEHSSVSSEQHDNSTASITEHKQVDEPTSLSTTQPHVVSSNSASVSPVLTPNHSFSTPPYASPTYTFQTMSPQTSPSTPRVTVDDKIKNIVSMYGGDKPKDQTPAPQPTIASPSYQAHGGASMDQMVQNVRRMESMSSPPGPAQQAAINPTPATFYATPRVAPTIPPYASQTSLYSTTVTAPGQPKPAEVDADKGQLLQQIHSLRSQLKEQENLQKQQVQMQKEFQLEMQTKHTLQQATVKEVADKLTESFGKIMSFMESVDQRLSHLEKTTNSLLAGNQLAVASPHMPPVIQPKIQTPPPTMSPPIVSPSAAILQLSQPPQPHSQPPTQAPTTFYPQITTFASNDHLVKRVDQYEADRELAAKLQAELDAETKTSEPKAEEKAKPTKKIEDSDSDITDCPICNIQVLKKELEYHVNECLDGGKKASAEAGKQEQKLAPGTENKPGLLTRLFSPNQTPTPQPKPATPTPTPTQQQPPKPSSSAYPGQQTNTRLPTPVATSTLKPQIAYQQAPPAYAIPQATNTPTPQAQTTQMQQPHPMQQQQPHPMQYAYRPYPGQMQPGMPFYPGQMQPGMMPPPPGSLPPGMAPPGMMPVMPDGSMPYYYVPQMQQQPQQHPSPNGPPK